MAKKPNGPDPVVVAAMQLAAERGWRGISLADIAERAGVGLPDLVDRFPTKTAILDAYARDVDRRMLAGGPDAGEPVRDRVFDVVMRRFDAMAGDRQALGNILRDTATDPWAAACGLRRYARSMALTLEAAGVSSSGCTGLARTHGLAAVYLYVLRVFVDDDSPDLARTMAALDKALRRAEDAASLLWRRRDRGARPAAEGKA